MSLLLVWLAGFSALELSMWLPFMRPLRKPIACIVIMGLSISSGLLVGYHLRVWAMLVCLLSVYRIINLLRILENRMQQRHLSQVSRMTSVSLLGLQLIILGAAWLSRQVHINTTTWLYAVSAFSFIGVGCLVFIAKRHINALSRPIKTMNVVDKDLPSLSVLIPARNETDDLRQCLDSLVTSDYPKLEIIVLDDCSQNKYTPKIIRDFARSGVHFIAGETPPENWLAKNFAYQQLANAANGDFLLFCGVDTRFKPESLRGMVETIMTRKKSMISFVPRNEPPTLRSSEAMMVQPARYGWEIALPRRFFRRPAVLSTCWLIRAHELRASGGFAAEANSISPESHFARHTAARHDGYSFLVSDSRIGLVSVKKLSEQRATAVRTRYPQLHKRPELVALQTLLQLTILALPFGLFIGSAIAGVWLLFYINMATCLLLGLFSAEIARLTYRRFLWRSLLFAPFISLYDTALLNHSMWQYEFREVIWKGRNVCIPLMETGAAVNNNLP